MQKVAEISPQEKRFQSQLPLRLELAAVERLVNPRRNDERVMLDIGFPSPVMSAALRSGGGAWCTIARSPEDATDYAQFLNAPVYCLEADGAIPFEAHSFDVVIVALDILAALGDTELFLRECNRVLKTSGELIISAQFRKKFNIVNVIRNRLAAKHGGFVGHSLTEADIYRLMKPGFDVLGISYYCGFFTELVRTWEVKLISEGQPEDLVCSTMRWKYWLAQQFDFFTMWVRGHIAIVRARRRRWRDRPVPVLADGRTIQEAVIIHEG